LPEKRLKKGCQLVKKWNLMVPSEIIHHTWKENDETIWVSGISFFNTILGEGI
jgi:hypothetical protein